MYQALTGKDIVNQLIGKEIGLAYGFLIEY